MLVFSAKLRKKIKSTRNKEKKCVKKCCLLRDYLSLLPAEAVVCLNTPQKLNFECTM